MKRAARILAALLLALPLSGCCTLLQIPSAHADRSRLLEEKFQEALKRADETPDEAVRRPFDDD